MTKNNENILKIDEVLDELYYLREENQQLTKDNKVLGNELTYFKEYCADLEEDVSRFKAHCKELTRENHELALENKDMKFTRKFLTAEDAGKAFAQSLLEGA